MSPFKLAQFVGAAVLVSSFTSFVSWADPSRSVPTRDFARMESDAGGIRRFAEIRPGLARGGEPYEAGIRYLQSRGYKTVVSFVPDTAESAQVAQSGMRYIHIPIRSNFFSCQLPSEEQVRQFLSVVSDTTLYPMFLHCHAGKDRTGAMAAIYRMEVCQWTPDEAVAEMKAFGFSGRYQRLFEFVQGYKPRSTIAESAPVPAMDAAAH